MPEGLPTSANIVIVGAVGVAIALLLAERGVQDVIVVEPPQITHALATYAARPRFSDVG